MKNRRPSSITTTFTYKVSAKNLRKGDNIWIGDRVYKVQRNLKSEDGKRVLDLTWGSKKEKDSATLTIRGSVSFTVRDAKHVRTPSPR